jgi:hypothetical protein
MFECFTGADTKVRSKWLDDESEDQSDKYHP